MELLRDIDKDTVDFHLNFDDTLQAAGDMLPARFPNLLVNGAERHRRGPGDQHPAAQPGRGHRRRSCACIDNPDITTRGA